MSVRFVLPPQAALDLLEIWQYIKEQSSVTIADRIESAVRERMAFLAGTPGAGHSRNDLTEEDLKFFSVYSYLIVYRPETKPLQIVHSPRPPGCGANPQTPLLSEACHRCRYTGVS